MSAHGDQGATVCFRCDCCGEPAPAAIDDNGLTYCEPCQARFNGMREAEREIVLRDFQLAALRAAGYLSIEGATDAFATAMGLAHDVRAAAARAGWPNLRDLHEFAIRTEAL